MTTSKNDFKNVSLQNLVDNPDCTEDDVAQWVRANDSLFEDESNPGEFSQDKVNKLFGDVMQNNALGSLGTWALTIPLSLTGLTSLAVKARKRRLSKAGILPAAF